MHMVDQYYTVFNVHSLVFSNSNKPEPIFTIEALRA